MLLKFNTRLQHFDTILMVGIVITVAYECQNTLSQNMITQLHGNRIAISIFSAFKILVGHLAHKTYHSQHQSKRFPHKEFGKLGPVHSKKRKYTV